MYLLENTDTSLKRYTTIDIQLAEDEIVFNMTNHIRCESAITSSVCALGPALPFPVITWLANYHLRSETTPPPNTPPPPADLP